VTSTRLRAAMQKYLSLRLSLLGNSRNSIAPFDFFHAANSNEAQDPDSTKPRYELRVLSAARPGVPMVLGIIPCCSTRLTIITLSTCYLLTSHPSV
jgi:hypothetical protein